MKKKYPNQLGLLLRAFFETYLVHLRGMSPHTIHSYRDSIVLLLRYLAAHKKRPVSMLNLKDVGHQDVYSFLIYLENKRDNCISTRNNRLSAIHSFFRFVASEHPDQLEHAQRIIGIPFKKSQSRTTDYLEYNEIKEILSTINRDNPKGRRDYTLLTTMFNTGARVQEILNLKAIDLQLTKPYQVQLLGKGRKHRYCPIWPQTASLLRQHCKELHINLNSETRIFKNCRGEPLTRYGVRYILNSCLKQAQRSMPHLSTKRLHPHSLRHSTAIALIKSGVDLSTVSQWLGHSSPNTTNRYATIDLDMKRKAIEKVKPLQDKNINIQWQKNKSIIEWLESL